MKLDDYLCVHGAARFKKLIANAKDFAGQDKIIVDPGDVRGIAEKSWQLIREVNKKRLRFFFYANSLAVLDMEGKNDGQPIVILEKFKLRHKLIRLGEWCYFKGKKMRPYVHSIAALEDILADLDPSLPRLKGVAPMPLFAADGTLATEPGYCVKTEFSYCPPANFSIPKINSNPTAADLKNAKELILEELLGNFPFVDKSDFSHAVGLLILPFVRNLINEPTPLHLIEKSTPGTGATLLAQAISHVCTGKDFSVFPEGKDGDETRKRLTAVLYNAPWFLVLDNLNKVLDSPALAIVLTQTYWEDRILGQTKHVHIPVWCVWVATGNNPTLSHEIARRSLRIRLDAKRENPHLRDPSEFRHPGLLVWIKENRSALVGAVLTLVQHWIASGRPKSKSEQSLGGFESWAAVIGGILDCAGIEGFLENTLDFYDDAQTENEQNKVFVAAWYRECKEDSVRASDLLAKPGISSLAYDIFEGTGDNRSSKTRLGFFIKKLKDKVFKFDDAIRSLTVVVRKSKKKIENTTAWRLEVLEKRIRVIFKKREHGDVREVS